jgi:multidrug efflux pump subunit AcrB
MGRSSIAVIVIILVITIALLALVLWLVAQDVRVDVAIGIIGVIGTASTNAALVYKKRQMRKANFAISRAAITFKGNIAKGYNEIHWGLA